MGRSRSNGRVPDERGVTIVLVALLLTVLAMFLGLAINVGHMALARGQLQNAADSGALAGIKDLGGNDIAAVRASLPTVRSVATTYSGYHVTDRDTAVSTPDVCLGRWDLATNAFQCVSPTPATDGALSNTEVYSINAVRVIGARNAQQTGGALPVYIGGLFGSRTTVDVPAPAIAARFGTCTGKCASPIVFAACQINAGMLPCGENALLMSNATEDDMGLSIYSSNRQANGPSIQDFLMTGNPPQCRETICEEIPDPTTDPNSPTMIKIQNGNALQHGNSQVSIFTSLSCLLNKTVDAGIAGVSCSLANQPTFSANGDPLLGFTRITITAIDVANKTITVRRECNSTDDPGGRCQDFGLLSSRAYLVH